MSALQPKLIRVSDTLISSTAQILKAWRCGNYTDLWMVGDSLGSVHQIWDPEKNLWDQISRSVE